MSLDDAVLWIKVVGMLKQNWAVVATDPVTTIMFFSDSAEVFDEIAFPDAPSAESALRRNGFKRYDEDLETKKFVARPRGELRQGTHPEGRIYSSSRYWRSA